MGVCTLVLDRKGSVATMDEPAERLWGLTDGAGTPCNRLFADCKEGSLPRGDRAEAIRRDGTRIPVAFETEFRDDGICLRVWDISDERAAEERVRRSESQLREAQEVAQIGSWVWDIENDAIAWSDELYRMYGLEPQSFEATFEAYLGHIHPDDVKLAQGVVEKAFQDMGPFSFDHRIVREDGEVRWLHGQGAVDARNGRPVRMYGVSQDITALKEAEERHREARDRELEIEHLRKLNDARSQMLNTVAHEMNTPLTPMRLQLHLLEGGILGDLNQRQMAAVDVLDKNLSRLAVLLSDMLDVARMESGHLKINTQPTDVGRLVQTTVEAFEAEAQQHRVRLVPNAEPVQALLDPDRLIQVFYNLVSNAIKFSEAGGEVRIRAGGKDQGLWIEVSDDGVGLSGQQMKGLFRPFSRVHDDPDRPGNGLGLHICKGIVEQHGGTLTCHSDGPGKGATFRVEIPHRHERQDIRAGLMA